MLLKDGTEHRNVKVCHEGGAESGGIHHPHLPFKCSKLKHDEEYLTETQENHLKSNRTLLLPNGEETEKYCLAYTCDGEKWGIQYQSCQQRNIRKVLIKLCTHRET